MSFPAPDTLGRGIVVLPGTPVPPPFAAAPRVVVDDAVLARPADTADVLHEAWTQRRRVVVELAVPAEALREPEQSLVAPHLLDPGFTFERERLGFLVWANNYDAVTRGPDDPVWWHGVRASRRGATHTPDGPADLVLADGRTPLVRRRPPPARRPRRRPRGPRRRPPRVGRRRPAHRRPATSAPTADLAARPAGRRGPRRRPARIIAPAGSGKTRVLTERLRHLIADRG